MRINSDKFRQSLTAALDDVALVRLGEDLLFTRGHTNIRYTDGPGDGGRDIHSLDLQGHPHLTQCKYHQDSDHACSSRELSELPMAMTKLGYTTGLFVTNSRISPQAKREFLNDYANLNLDFLDGEILAKEVLSNGLLTALWHEGNDFTKVNVSTIFPTIIRVHEGDTPFDPFRAGHTDFEPLLADLRSRHEEYKFAVQPGRSSTQPFEPYRAPEPLTLEEGALPFLGVIEIVATGHLRLSEIHTLTQSICEGVVAWLFPMVGGLTVRVGGPSIVPLQGKDSGIRVLSSINPVSYVGTKSYQGFESEYFVAEPSDNWSSLSDARVSEADWICLYSKDLDCCLAYEIETRISSAVRTTQEAIREIQKKGWDRSVFCLLPEWEKWPHTAIPEPDEKILWPWDGRILCGWYHWSILGVPVRIRTGLESPSESLADKQSREEFFKLRSFLRSLPEATLLNPNNARHMVALVGSDPFPDIGFTVIRTADVIAYPEGIPSPIQPASRRFRITKAWRSTMTTETAEAAVTKSLSDLDSNLFGTATVERWKEYIVVTVEIDSEKICTSPTFAVLDTLSGELNRLIPPLEEKLRESETVEPAIKELWAKRFNINLGMSWEKSDKLYVGTFREDGTLEKIDAKSWLESGFSKTEGGDEE